MVSAWPAAIAFVRGGDNAEQQRASRERSRVVQALLDGSGIGGSRPRKALTERLDKLKLGETCTVTQRRNINQWSTFYTMFEHGCVELMLCRFFVCHSGNSLCREFWFRCREQEGSFDGLPAYEISAATHEFVRGHVILHVKYGGRAAEGEDARATMTPPPAPMGPQCLSCS